MFEWNERKAAINLTKHRVSFVEAMTAFSDPESMDAPDLAHSSQEKRFLRVAKSAMGNVLTIAYTLRRNENDQAKVRIISARRASRKERKIYEKSSP